jgi:hypothetical protein
LWIHLGVQLDYFPVGPSRRVIYEFFPMILKAYEVFSKTVYFETAFVAPLRAIWESELSGNLALFATGQLWEEANVPSEGAAAFRTAYLYANEFVQDLETRPFVQGITFSKEQEWESAIKNNKPLAEVKKNEASAKFSGENHWATPSVFSTVDYLRTTAQIRLSPENDTKTFVDLRQRLREIQQWRLNFLDRSYRDRFRLAAKAVAEKVTRDEKIVGVFLNEIYELTVLWGAPRRDMAARG